MKVVKALMTVRHISQVIGFVVGRAARGNCVNIVSSPKEPGSAQASTGLCFRACHSPMAGIGGFRQLDSGHISGPARRFCQEELIRQSVGANFGRGIRLHELVWHNGGAAQPHSIAYWLFHVDVSSSPEECLVFVGPMTIRDAFKLAVVDRILLEDVANRTFESLADSRLVAIWLLVIRRMLTCSSFRCVVRP